jgi:protein arginine kinase
VQPSAWLGGVPDGGIVVSCRVRLARNLAGVRFPPSCDEGELVQIWNELRSVLTDLPGIENPIALEMSSLGWTDRHVLQERHLISMEQTEAGKGSGVVLSEDERISVMVNEEDHLRIQVMSPGMDIGAAWARANAVDSEIEKRVRYAFSPTLGYLTSCPTNVGTGLRASVMLHMPGLGLQNEAEPVIKGLSKIGLAVRGLLGEGTEAFGNMFQISNQRTLGESEETMIKRLTTIVEQIVDHEKNARARLADQREAQLRDFVGRAFGVLQNARLLSSREVLDLLSSLWLGAELDLVAGLSIGAIHELMLLTQPGHMQKNMRKEFGPDERDEVRSRIVRSRLQGISLRI